MIIVKVTISKGCMGSSPRRIFTRPLKHQQRGHRRGKVIYRCSPSRQHHRRRMIYQSDNSASRCRKNVPLPGRSSQSSITAIFRDWVYTWGLPKLRETAQKAIVSRKLAYLKIIFSPKANIRWIRFPYDEKAWLR